MDDTEKAQTFAQETPEQTASGKKPWKTPNLTILPVPTKTQSGGYPGGWEIALYTTS